MPALDIGAVRENRQSSDAAAIAASEAAQAGIAAIAQAGRGKKAHKRSKELMDIQFRNQQALNRQGQQLQMDTWMQTNYPAQMEMLEKAGLNPALIYGMKGGGGVTTGSQGGGSAASGTSHAPMDIGAIIQASLAGAQKQLMEAQAEKAKAEAGSIKGEEGTTGAAQIEANLATALNQRSQAKMNELGYEIGNATKEDQIDNAHYQVEKLIKENNLTDEQANLVKIQTLATGVRMQLDRANIKVSEEQARKLSNDIILGWEELSAKMQELGIYNQGNKLRAMEGKTKLQEIQNDFILGVLGKEIDLHKLNIEQQKIFTSMFNTMLIGGSIMGKAPTEIHNY